MQVNNDFGITISTKYLKSSFVMLRRTLKKSSFKFFRKQLENKNLCNIILNFMITNRLIELRFFNYSVSTFEGTY